MVEGGVAEWRMDGVGWAVKLGFGLRGAVRGRGAEVRECFDEWGGKLGWGWGGG